MKAGCLTLIFAFVVLSAHAQKYISEKSNVTFFSKGAIEDITAHNTKATSLFNNTTSDIAFVIPIADFEFAKALMKQHFNEKYMNTEQFPKATFEGTLNGFDSKISGDQHATAKGKMTIHGVSHEVEIPGTMTTRSTGVMLHAKFPIKLADYNITIPTLLFKNIATQVDVTIEFIYKAQ